MARDAVPGCVAKAAATRLLLLVLSAADMTEGQDASLPILISNCCRNQSSATRLILCFVMPHTDIIKQAHGVFLQPGMS